MKSPAISIVLLLSLYSSIFSLDQNWGFEKRGISYYPRSAAWDSMWVYFDADTIRNDFTEISRLGCNYVRIFIRHRVCGYSNSELYRKFKQNFDTLLGIADSLELELNVVLFDGYDPELYAFSDSARTWIDSVVAPRKNIKRIIRWELLSEIDRVYRDSTTNNVLEWYQDVFPHLKKSKGEQQEATVSVNVSDNAGEEIKFFHLITTLGDSCRPDIYGFTYAKYASLLPAIYDCIKCIIGSDKKIFIAELTWDTCTKSELFQHDQYRNSFWYMREVGIKDVCIWTLWDFIHKDMPELKETKQHHYGLLRTDGSRKPSYEVVKSVFHGIPLEYKIANASFEAPIDSLKEHCDTTAYYKDSLFVADSWQFWPSGRNDLDKYAVVDSEQYFDDGGQKSLKISSNFLSGAYYEQGIPVIPGKYYRLRGYLKTEGNTKKSFISISWHKSSIYDNCTWIYDSTNEEVIEAHDWKLLEVINKAPCNSAIAKIFCKSENESNEAKAYFDALSFSPINEVKIQVICDSTIQSDYTVVTFRNNVDSISIVLNNSNIDTSFFLDDGSYEVKIQCFYNENLTYSYTFGDTIIIREDVVFKFIILPTSVEIIKNFQDNKLRTDTCSLYPAYPNPFNSSTTIEFYLPKAQFVELNIFDILGRKVKNIISDKLDPGKHSKTWNGSDERGNVVAAGIYFVRMIAGEFKQSRKILLIK
ncbi:MAG: T9SS type A sorting domain-containing protein [bacterium]|nr:MAG: T9SS type A sorting domain-containing protein [bacterium]